MKAFKIYSEDRMGFENEIVYVCNYNKAIEIFNEKLREELKNIGDDVVNKQDFSEEVQEFREWNKDSELLCRKYPLLIHRPKDSNKIVGTIPYWTKTGYEYNEYEILGELITLEEIELIE